MTEEVNVCDYMFNAFINLTMASFFTDEREGVPREEPHHYTRTRPGSRTGTRGVPREEPHHYTRTRPGSRTGTRGGPRLVFGGGGGRWSVVVIYHSTYEPGGGATHVLFYLHKG